LRTGLGSLRVADPQLALHKQPPARLIVLIAGQEVRVIGQ
jgi:hypothetical protein